MRDNLRLNHKILPQLVKLLPAERITRVRNLALFMTGLVLSMTVQLPHIVKKWPTPGRQRSLVNRLSRFLNNAHVDPETYFEPVLRQLLGRFSHAPLNLIVDCTKVGFNFRLLTVAVAYRKRTLPLVWRVYEGGKGHVPAADTIELVRHVLQCLPATRTAPIHLAGDSGFESVELYKWLRQQGIDFTIRLRGSVYFQRAGKPETWEQLADVALEMGDTIEMGWVRITKSHNQGWHYLVAHWAEGEDEPWYLLSSLCAVRPILKSYQRRMWIEEMYGDMKGHGFDLEATHLRDTERIARLVMAVCWVYVWFMALGSWVVKSGKRARVDVKSRRDKSYFRLGWDWLEDCLRLGNDCFRLRFVPYL